MPALDLKKWHEKLDRKLLLPAMFNQLLVVMSVIIFSVTIDQIWFILQINDYVIVIQLPDNFIRIDLFAWDILHFI